IVNDVADRKNFVKRMGELAAGTKTTMYAWVLMTNHAQILLPAEDYAEKINEFIAKGRLT
ncbi:MAG: hypothetical protein JSW26_08165, partial [Desulfobacterales bacterium]